MYALWYLNKGSKISWKYNKHVIRKSIIFPHGKTLPYAALTFVVFEF